MGLTYYIQSHDSDDMHSDDRSVSFPPKSDGDKRIILGIGTTGEVREAGRSGSNDFLSLFTPSHESI